jgi:hypothetical protein
MLTRQEVCHQHDRSVGEFQRVMMGGNIFWVDLTKAGKLTGRGSPPKQSSVPRLLCERNFGTGTQTYRRLKVASASKPARDGIAKAGRYKMIGNDGRPGRHVRKAVITHLNLHIPVFFDNRCSDGVFPTQRNLMKAPVPQHDMRAQEHRY